jgi:hypothetical protein
MVGTVEVVVPGGRSQAHLTTDDRTEMRGDGK